VAGDVTVLGTANDAARALGTDVAGIWAIETKGRPVFLKDGRRVWIHAERPDTATPWTFTMREAP
jgi:hypothetical protein